MLFLPQFHIGLKSNVSLEKHLEKKFTPQGYLSFPCFINVFNFDANVTNTKTTKTYDKRICVNLNSKHKIKESK
jgi:hypothetical protein